MKIYAYKEKRSRETKVYHLIDLIHRITNVVGEGLFKWGRFRGHNSVYFLIFLSILNP